MEDTLASLLDISPPQVAIDPESYDAARLTRLALLPVRLELGKLARVIALHEAGKSIAAIARQTRLDPVVVALELQRAPDYALLSTREMNSLARDTHIPNRQLRDLIEHEIQRTPGLTLNAILQAAGVSDNSHGRRMLGYAPHSCSARPAQTIEVAYAERITDALGIAHVEVEGL